MRYICTFFKAILSVYGFLVFLALLLLVFPFVVMASFFGRIRGGNMIYKLCLWFSDVFFLLCGIFHINKDDVKNVPDRQYVYVFNHISYLDIPVIIKTLRSQKFRILGRSDLASVPVFGFLYKNAAILVDRSNREKRAKSVRRLKAVLRKGISIVIAPEGTFNPTDKPLKDFYDGAFRIAIETQTPIKPVLLLDTNDRFNQNSIFSLTPGRSRSIFLETVNVDGMTLNDLPELKQKVYTLMEEKLIYYKVSWIK